MKKIYFLILTFFLTIPFGFGQQNNFNWRIGLQTGNMTYRGDLNEKFWQSNDMFATDFNQFSFGLSIENTPNKTLSNRLQLTYGEFTANDRATGILERSLNVQTKIYSAAYIFTFYTDNGWLLGENALVSPYLMAGIGGNYFETYGDLYYNDNQPYYYWSDNTIRDAAENSGNGQIITQDGSFETRLQDFNTESSTGYSPYSLNVPLGIGLKFRLLNRLSLHLQSVVNYSLTSDFLDDVSGDFRSSYESAETAYIANPANYNGGQGSRGNTGQGFLKNDAFIFTSFGISWSFSPKKQAFRAPALYAANKPKSVFELNPDSLKTVTVDGIPDYTKNSEIKVETNTSQNQNSQNNQNAQQQNQGQNPYNYNPNQQYPYQQNPNPQTVKIDINVNVTTSKSGSDSSITRVEVIPQTGQTTTNSASKTEQTTELEETKAELEELQNRLKQIEEDKKTKKTRAERKADEEAQKQARLEMDTLQKQLEELRAERQNNLSITLDNPNQATTTTQKQDSAMYKLMELQFLYMQQRMAALEKQLETQEIQNQNTEKNQDLSKIENQLSTLQTQLELLANQRQNEKLVETNSNWSENSNPVSKKDTVVVVNKDEKTPITNQKSEVVGVKKIEIFFKTGSSTVIPKDKEKISPLIEVLKNDKNLSVRIYGFTDSKGSAAFNQKLSKQRTDAVKQLFLDAGISEDRIVEGSFGIDTNNPYREDFYGRRVEIELVGK
ncbi:OmpA family protein [Bernardetia sp.]|uniref:OmpA family protein n=1 Tax=Bernardetia sp. TaxID=1937974 RepID=UPI0025BE72D3|nr:OmpA family protein [Bernardetia sp.]